MHSTRQGQVACSRGVNACRTRTWCAMQGVVVLNKAVEACQSSIVGSKGRLTVKEAARAVSEKEEKALDEQLQELENSNRWVWGQGRAGGWKLRLDGWDELVHSSAH